MSSKRMRKAQRGMTIIELVMAIVIIGLGLAGLMLAFSMVVKSSSDPMIRKQMLAIAEQMMEEITMKQFLGTTAIAAVPCRRNTWTGLQDYYNVGTSDGYDTSKTNCLSSGPAGTSKIYDVNGTAIAALQGYSVAVVMAQLALTSTAAVSVSAINSMRITVTVTHGADQLVLVGWRTNYAS